MNDSRDKQFCEIVKKAIKPMGARELQKDLWNQLRIKLPQPGIYVPVFDWFLAALAVILSFLVPESFLGLLAHL